MRLLTHVRHRNPLSRQPNLGNAHDAPSVSQDVETEGGEAEAEGEDDLGGLERVLDERFVAALHALRDAKMQEVLGATDGEADPPDEVRWVSTSLFRWARHAWALGTCVPVGFACIGTGVAGASPNMRWEVTGTATLASAVSAPTALQNARVPAPALCLT